MKTEKDIEKKIAKFDKLMIDPNVSSLNALRYIAYAKALSWVLK